MGSTKLATCWDCLGTGGRQGAELGKGNGGHGGKRDVRGDGGMALDPSPGHTPVPVGELALAGSHQHDVIDLVFNAEGVLRGGLILGARIRAHVGVL